MSDIDLESRPIVDNRGRKIASIREAVRIIGFKPCQFLAAIQATEAGAFRTLAQYQWAFVDATPDTWPKRRLPGKVAIRVIRSDGVEFESTASAARTHVTDSAHIIHACRRTEKGCHFVIDGYQFAYNKAPKIWPSGD